MLKNKVFTEEVEILDKLKLLEVSKNDLLEVVDAMVLARNECTDNDPPSTPGFMAWSRGTRRLRDVLCIKENWQKDDSNYTYSAINHNLGIKIVVCNTDSATGLIHKNNFPQNRSRKGYATEINVSQNQLSFMDILDDSISDSDIVNVTKLDNIITTYYLCVYHENDTIRAELSLPLKVKNGFLSNYIERIILISNTDNYSPVKIPDDSADDIIEFNIPITKK